MSRRVFFGYPQSPASGADALRAAARTISTSGAADASTWEDLRVGGTVVINQVLEAIDDADMSIFDLTRPNPNVLFELGYAIGRAKPVWITLDSTNNSAKQRWRDLAVLSSVGYVPYRNSDDLAKSFASQNPLDKLTPLYDEVIEPSLPPHTNETNLVLYCNTFEPFEAANRLNTFLDGRRRRGLDLVVSDPVETSLSPLDWFTPRIAVAAGVLVNFAGEDRNRSSVYNNRHALIAGIAVGLEIPTCLLAEEDYSAPFDYQDRLHVYETAEECVAHARNWLESLEYSGMVWTPPRASTSSPLSKLTFGEHVAENERAELNDYFIETSAYFDVIRARDSIFIGHRGTGKTANAIQAFQKISENKTNLAILIKPPGFEFPAMLAVVERLPDFQHDYFFDSLWRFVIETEIASAVVQKLETRSKYVPFDTAEQRFLSYASSTPFDMRASMSVRLEQALDSLHDSLEKSERVSSERNLINEFFHTESLAVLRSQLGVILKDRKRVAVFVDNLDKGWERGADFGVMARFILGLLTARGHVVTDFEKEDYWRDSIKITVAIFLRSDIYSYLRREAREPDKLPLSTISWRDKETLRSLVETRFLVSDLQPSSTAELWDHYFTRAVLGEPTTQYLARVVLPRPRDVVFFCNAAVGRAIDRVHETVLEEDFEAARETYSQYAYEALLVENGVTIPEMEDALLSLIGSRAITTVSECKSRLLGIGIDGERLEVILGKLTATSFFGLEVEPDNFRYPEVGSDMKAAMAKSVRVQADREKQRVQIHPAFHAFLEIR